MRGWFAHGARCLVAGTVLVSMTTPVWSQQANAPVTSAAEKAEKKETPSEKEILLTSVRDALRRRLNFSEQPQFNADSSMQDAAGNAVSQPQTLTLPELLNLVELYHPKLRGADVERRIASAKRLEKQGAFDPVFNVGTDYLRFNTEFDAKNPRGKVASSRLADASVEFLTRSGLKVGAGTRFNFGKIKAPLSPTGEGGEYFVEFKMPLLRGFRINEKSAAERQALLGEPLADAQFQLTRLDLLLKAATTYWDWVAAKRKLDVARSLLELSEFRLRAVRDRVSAGDLPQIDEVEAGAELQRRQGNVVKAERDLQKAAFKLSLFLWAPNGLPAPIPQEANVPTSNPPPVLFPDDQATTGQTMALDRRPELRVIGLSRDITQIDLDLARNQRRPALDVAFSPGRDAGAGGIGNTLKAGVNFSLPLRQRTADGRIAASNLKLEKIALELLTERQRISTEVLDALSAINTAYGRYQAAEQEVVLAQRLEEGERTRFQLGDSTLFLVNQRERATAEARSKLIEIQAEYEQAVATFRTVTVQY